MDNDIKNISNIKVHKDVYKFLKKLSVDDEVTIQKVIQDILERVAKKKGKQDIQE